MITPSVEKPSTYHRLFTTFLSGLLLAGLFLSSAAAIWQAPDDSRKLKKSTPAEYPELARKYNITGTVRLQLLVTPEGKVKEAKVLGGNAVLAKSFIEAVMKWQYEPAPHASVIIVSGDFKP